MPKLPGGSGSPVICLCAPRAQETSGKISFFIPSGNGDDGAQLSGRPRRRCHGIADVVREGCVTHHSVRQSTA